MPVPEAMARVPVGCEGRGPRCGDGCCEPYEQCLLDREDEDICVTCGGDRDARCGDTCCEGSAVCYLGQCVMPGADCSVGTCATREVQTDCGPAEVCDAATGKCMPASVADSCIYQPPPQVFEPMPRFTWGARRVRACDALGGCQAAETCVDNICTITWPHIDIPVDGREAFGQVSSTPMVADLDGDCVPEIIFNSYADGDFNGPGVVRAIRGDTGEKVWTSDPLLAVSNGTANLAVGDIDSDGLPEVVVQGDGQHLMAWDSDGTFLWQSETFSDAVSSGATAIVNMDGEADPEIVFGSAIFASDGTLLFQRQQLPGGTGFGFGQDGQGPISCVADLDGDGRPEVIGGGTAYRFTGTVLGGDFAPVDGAGTPDLPYWHSDAGDGKCGVADFDLDSKPEVTVVRNGEIYVLNGQTGASLAAPFAIPGADNRGGAPNIADFDGDGRPDIGTAGPSNYVVVRFDGSTFEQMWQAATQDTSSRVTGSSVFDFDGDGTAEVIYNDELYLRIYPGVEPDCLSTPPGPGCDGIMTDGEVLFRDFNGSRTRTEYPVVADVDGDFKAELVFSTNNDSGAAPDGMGGTKQLDKGIEVWEDRLDNWVGTRPIWNQHSYHVTNVDVSGGIPAQEAPNWSTLNHYRNNDQGSLASQCAPDLVPYDLRAEECTAAVLSARVVNFGCLGVGAGVTVAFYAEGLGLLGTVRTAAPIGAGAGETVELRTGMDLAELEVWVVLDDDGQGTGAVNECDEDNNTSERVLCEPGVLLQ